MKYFLMILTAMAFAGCSFDYKSPAVFANSGDALADSRDSNDGDAGEEVEFNPPLPENDSEPPPIDTGPDTEDGEETAMPETDAPTDPETADAVDSDEFGDAPDVPADGDSNGVDSDNIVEPGADAIDAQDTPDAEVEASLPCIPNCADKQCGDNGCEGSCGSCPDGLTCNADFVCECVMGCLPAEPTTDVVDTTDVDASTATTADVKIDTLSTTDASPPDETGGPTAETTSAADAAIDTLQSETNPSVDTLVNAEPSTDTNIAEVVAEITNEDTATMVEVTPNADTAAEAEAETDEDASEPDTFVLPCLANPLLCDDNNECTADTCTLDGCQHEPQTGMACNDGNACTESDICDEDVCAGKTIICNDQNPCTDDACNKQSGCVYNSNNANPCEDGSLCTMGDFCDAGQCQGGGQALKCEDGNLCTDDVCQPQKGCVYPANQAGCDDGNSCTVGDICADMACASGTNICQCQNDAVCAKADDDNLCNGTIVCDQSAIPFKCVTDPDTVITCDANQDTACLKNTCVPATGDCEMTAVNQGGACDDGNACTSNDQCANGSCAGQSVKCDDSNVCTDDSCDPASGCVFTPNKADCDDGSVCTMLDVCQGGQCVGMAKVDCTDFNECTLDVCHKTTGCLHSNLNGQACDNGDACTVDDTCQNGACQAGTQNNCDCYTTADCAGVEDGDLCNGTLICDTNAMPHKCALDPATVITCPVTSDTTCSKNTCQPSSGKCEMEAVNDGDTCQTGQCVASATCQSGQCVVMNKPDGTECDDGKSCSVDDTCQSGICESGGPIYFEGFSNGQPEGWITSHSPTGDWIQVQFVESALKFVAKPGAETTIISATSPAIILPSGESILSGNFLEHDLKFSEIRILEAASDKVLLSLSMKSGYEVLQTFSLDISSLGSMAIKIMCFSDMKYYGWVWWDNLTIGCP